MTLSAFLFASSACSVGSVLSMFAVSPKPRAVTLLVTTPADCECAASVVGNDSQQPTTIYCGNQAEPCISFVYEKLDGDSSNTPGNCGLAGEPPCGSASGCTYTSYVVKPQLASCIASCGTGPFRAYNASGPVGKKMENPGDKVTIPVIPNDAACDESKQYHFEVRDSSPTPQVIGRYTLTAGCAACARAGR